MSDTKFTPGPWRVDDTYEDAATVLGPDGFPVATPEETAILPDYASRTSHRHWAHGEGEAYIERDEVEWRANAHLIAAAPDLYEAC